jgi:hypothetical protein
MKTITIEGIISFHKIEGGFWGLVSTENKKWRFVHLPDKYQQEGLQAKLTVRLVDEVVSFIMWGKPVEVIE